MQKKIAFLAAMLMICVSSVMAQVTTSALSGKVIADGEAVIGATIEAIHKPSGTRYNAVTNIKGQYTINGMRVGGPYEVKVTYIGFETKSYNDVTLQLGETYNINTTMNEDAKQLGEVVVVGKGTKFHEEKTGASTNISNLQILNMPTVSRSITDFTRLSPYGGNGMTFGSSDGRTANFTVDGANFNNDFGLSSGLPGGGSPISIDAIEEMQVVISPYDVRQTGFIGGGVNAITKSGTNTFKGTAYIYHRNENLRGDAVDGTQITTAREKDRKTTYGFTLGGPIIKDKLFFFLNGEMVKSPTQPVTWRGSENGVSDGYSVSRTTLKDLQTVSDYVKDKYGYDTGSYTSFPADESNYKFLARLDWNINNNNHLALRYNYTKNRGWNAPNASSMDGGTRMSGGRVSQYSMSYANSMYAIDNLVHSFSLDLNSRISNNLSNQLLATFAKKDDVRYTESSEFPMIDILKDNQAYISLGYELFTWNNAVHTTNWNVRDDITWYAGNHKVMAGVAFEHQMADNMYMRNGNGYYRYKSLDDFLTGAAPEIVGLTYGYDGKTDPAARVTYNVASAYLQDEWDVTSRLKLDLGLRVDTYMFNNSDLVTNQALLAVDYDGRHVDTGKWPTTKPSFSPRLGFVWDVLGNKSLKVRGGTGLFTGRLPLVFFTNMPSNSGMIQYSAIFSEKNKSDMSKFEGGLVTDANNHATVNALYNKMISLDKPTSAGTGKLSSGMCGVDPDFKMPQVWKSSVAVDYAIPVSFPLTITGEFIYSRFINSATVEDYSVPSVAGFSRFNGADNRAIFPEGFQNGSSLYVLSNTSKGYQYQASVELVGRPFNWMDFKLSYTNTAAKEITSLPGSNASSVLNYIATVDGPNPNNMQLHNAYNVTPHRFLASVNLHDKCCNHYSIIYEAWNGSYNYTYEMVNDMNGDGYNYDCLYIPTDDQVANKQFRFVSADDQQRFMDYVHNSPYLSKHQGEYAGTYAVPNPFVHRVDVSYKHDFKLNWGNTAHKLQLSCDVKNVLNLFNSSWGVQKIANTEFTGSSKGMRILKYEGVDAEGYATFSTPKAINGNTQTWVKDVTVGQCWYASIGIKYFFSGERQSGCGCKDADVNFDNNALNELVAKNRALVAENDRLKAAKAAAPVVVAQAAAPVVVAEAAAPVVVEPAQTLKSVVANNVVLAFDEGSSELTNLGKVMLDQISQGSTITIQGGTSPELFTARSKAVAEYLKSRGVNVLAPGCNNSCCSATVTIK